MRAAAGATDLMGLDKYNTGRQVDLANALEAQARKSRRTRKRSSTRNIRTFYASRATAPT